MGDGLFYEWCVVIKILVAASDYLPGRYDTSADFSKTKVIGSRFL